MKTIGLIGGFSPESTALYYRTINTEVRRRRGRLHSAPILLHSLDFEQIVEMLRIGNWSAAASLLCEAGRGLHDAGAQCLALCTNTMHRVASDIEESLPPHIPLLHIGDAVGAAIRSAGFRRVCLFGTLYTMEQDFLSDYLYARYGIETITPGQTERERVHEILYDELYRGHVRAESRRQLAEIALSLHQVHDVQAVLLGSAELTPLIGEETGPFPLPRFDTAILHARSIARHAILARTAPLPTAYLTK